jgi:hypothetical protein
VLWTGWGTGHDTRPLSQSLPDLSVVVSGDGVEWLGFTT